MNTDTFIADGKTRVFQFAFPFFLKSDVIVEVDSQPATNYNMSCVKNGAGADFPFSGGEIRFNRPPKTASVITITRKLPLRRIVDFQPTAEYDADAHNRDMNYVMEIIKDICARMDVLMAQPSESTNAQAIATILEQVQVIISAIDEIRTDMSKPDEPVDLSAIYQELESLGTSIGALRAWCEQIDGRENDYLVDYQLPTVANNYTWYRKYKSGWIEQGGAMSTNGSNATLVSLPCEMANSAYSMEVQGRTGSDGYDNAQWQIMPILTNKSPKTTTAFYVQASITGYNLYFYWHIAGIVA